MSSLQHVYRRGRIFWWRRVHRSFPNVAIEARLSLGTADRFQARNRGAALTAAYEQVAEMLKGQERAKRDITEGELQAIAKPMYEERLAELCTEQRAAPGDAEFHSAANRAFVDYFDRLADRGGHMSLLDSEKAALQAQGWDGQRINDLHGIIDMREARGISSIRQDDVDRHLRAAGLNPGEEMRCKLQLVLFSAY